MVTTDDVYFRVSQIEDKVNGLKGNQAAFFNLFAEIQKSLEEIKREIRKR